MEPVQAGAGRCIYHITPVENLPGIVEAGGLVSDKIMLEKGGPATSIGMSDIKARRLKLPVTCHPGDLVGQYVPFYYCPRSVMLYVIYKANHPDLQYRGGQRPILHLEFHLDEVLAWASKVGRPWAIALQNAGAIYTTFRGSTSGLEELDWNAIQSTDFRDLKVQGKKQAEFLVKDSIPWSLVRRIGAQNKTTLEHATRACADAQHRPRLELTPSWYF